MSALSRWIVGIAGLLFALSAFVALTVSAHAWMAVVLGAIVGGFGFVAAKRRTSWQGALLTLAGIWMAASSFVGGVQTGLGHFGLNLLTGLAVVAVTLFVRDEATTPA